MKLKRKYRDSNTADEVDLLDLDNVAIGAPLKRILLDIYKKLGWEQ